MCGLVSFYNPWSAYCGKRVSPNQSQLQTMEFLLMWNVIAAMDHDILYIHEQGSCQMNCTRISFHLY